MAILDAGAVGHCHVEFAAMALEGAIERAAWDEVDHYCTRLQPQVRAEQIPLGDFILRRARALAADALGNGDSSRIAALAAEARANSLDVYLDRLAAA